MTSADGGLPPWQIAVIVSVIVATSLLIVLAVGLRYFVVRRRRHQVVEPIREPKYSVTPDSTVSQAERGEANGANESRASEAESHNSSIWGDMGRSAEVPASTFSADALDSRHWPLPPGHPERYTFFSESSSTTVDDRLEIQRWSTEESDEVGRDDDVANATGRSETRNMGRTSSDSIWGMPGGRGLT
ncbi:hypothetical protein GGR52DRAFT_433720 [Hypoxylon sp. FL1284]|nr:hypothetical protein GGR52DRAFT_433720 [Hypoxylon sp. FL1284]